MLVNFWDPALFTGPKAKKRSRILTDQELKAVWNACDEESEIPSQFRQIVKLLICTGQRRNEIAALQGSFYSPNRQTRTNKSTCCRCLRRRSGSSIH